MRPDPRSRTASPPWRKRGRMLGALALLLTCCASAAAAETEGAAPTEVVRSAVRTFPLGDAVSLAAYVDGVIETQRRDHDIPGAAVAIVDRDGNLLVRGWGYAHLPDRRRVDPERTRFRIGSVTKTFTWTAVMQGVAAGRLSLDADVNTWLETFSIPVPDGRPVTLTDLMTHSAGFEESSIGLNLAAGETRPTLAETLARRRPEIVYPPGALPAYSNYGSALAGHLAARTRGVDWDRLIREDLLEPLAMDSTTTAELDPDEADFAPGHRASAGAMRPMATWHIRDRPAGVISSTAADMARWMRMHLNDGALDGARVLPADSARRMREPLRQFHPQVPPMLHGFYRLDRGGEQIVGHEGSINDTVSLMALFPDRGIGVFVVYNAEVPRAPRAFLDAMVDLLVPRDLPEPRLPPTGFDERAGRYVGEYASTRRNHSHLQKAAQLAGGLQVSAHDGHLVTRAGGEARQWVELAPDEFRARDGRTRLSFTETADGEMFLWLSSNPTSALQQRTGIRSPELHRSLLAIAGSVLLLALLGWPLAALRSGQRMVFGQVPRVPTGRVMLAWCTAALGLTGTVIVLLGLGDPDAFLDGVPRFTLVGLWVNAAFLLLTLPCFLSATATLLGHEGTFGQRFRLWCVGVAAMLLAFVLLYWNLVPWKLPPG